MAQRGAKQYYSLPSQSLENAIQQLAMQSGRQVVFAPSALTQKKSREITGYMRFEDALRQLLKNSGLVFRQNRGGVILLERAPEKAPPHEQVDNSLSSPPATPHVVVTAINTADIVSFSSDLQYRPSATSLEGVVESSPSVTSQPGNAGQRGLTIRGVGNVGETTTIVYFGDVAVSGPTGTASDSARTTMDLAMVDIGAVRTSRVARSTEHGAGALAGEIEIQPEEAALGEWRGKGSVGFGVIEGGSPGYQITSTLNGPIGANAAFRVTGYSIRQGGYVDNLRTGQEDVNDDDIQGVRFMFRYVPDDRLHLSAMGLWQHRRINDSSAWTRNLGPYNMDRQFSAKTEHDFLLGRLKAEYEGDDFKITSVSAYYRWKLDRNYDRTPVTLQQADMPEGCQRYYNLSEEQCTADQRGAYSAYVLSLTPSLLHIPITLNRVMQEFRASTAPSAPLRSTAGLFIDHKNEQFYSSLSSVSIDRIEPIEYFGQRHVKIKKTQFSLFGDVAYHGDGGFLASVGGRYDWHHASSRNRVLIPNIVSGATESWPLTVRESQGLYLRSHLDVPVHALAALHFQVTQSYRPGGVNIASVLLPDSRTYASDRITGIEVGVSIKRKPLFSMSVMAYLNYWNNVQYRALSENNSNAYIVNIGNARIRGVEMELILNPAPGLNLKWESSLTFSRLNSVTGASSLLYAHVGDHIPFVPRHRSAFNVTQAWSIDDEHSLNLSGDMQVQSGYTSSFSAADPNYLATKGFALMTVKAAYQGPKSSLSLTVANIFNQQADLRAATTGYGIGQAYSYRPREIMLTWTRNW